MNHNHHDHAGAMGMMSGDGAGGEMGGMRAGGGMPVAFDFGCEVTLFFDAWATSTAFQYLVALVGVFTLCIAQERLFYFRTSLRLGEGVFAREDLSAPIVPKPYRCVCCWVLQSLAKSSQSRPVHCIHHVCRTLGTLCPSLTSVPPAHRVPLTKLHPKSVPNVRQRSLGTFLYGANLVSSYLVMLAVMTCNFGVFVSVVAGLASGHFLFASRRPLAAGPTNSEACHPEY
jgi:hypothetical protein|tara:strand:- start:1346 stop:2032 length:687 start_codon:yes stop_codon:yes gene_type:complete